jgi:hypothetical protein
MNQLELWPNPEPRIVVICSDCGREIVVREVVVDTRYMSAIYSEYQDAEGRCFDCSRKSRSKRP